MNAAAPLLAGLRVVELSAFVAAPLGGATLAALGADVIRVDPPGGGIDIDRWPLHRGRSLYWAGLNQGKRSVTIDTRSEAGRRQVSKLIAAPGEGGGIVLTNLPVKGWNSYQELSKLRPDLIMVVITGDRDGGTAVDYTVNAAVGFPWLTGPEDHDGPVNHVLPAWDGMTGFLAAFAILAAERHRRLHREGQLVELSLADVAMAIAGHLGLLGEAILEPEPRGRFGNHVYA
jgi:2-methylfumaryl-CoA isomerase